MLLFCVWFRVQKLSLLSGFYGNIQNSFMELIYLWNYISNKFKPSFMSQQFKANSTSYLPTKFIHQIISLPFWTSFTYLFRYLFIPVFCWKLDSSPGLYLGSILFGVWWWVQARVNYRSSLSICGDMPLLVYCGYRLLWIVLLVGLWLFWLSESH